MQPGPTRDQPAEVPEEWKTIEGYTWPGIEFGEAPTFKHSFFEVGLG